MKNKTTTVETMGKQVKEFVFDPENLNITELYVTSTYNEGGNTSARIFANGVMQAHLLLNYSYNFDPAEFPEDMPEQEILDTIQSETEAYLQNPDNLRIYDAAHPDQDITENEISWDRVYASNGYLHDLDNSSKAIEQLQTADFIFNLYITPPASSSVNYTLLAELPVNDATTNHITIQAEVFNVTKDDLEVRSIAVRSHGDRDIATELLALTYTNSSTYGAATLNHIAQEDYLGMVLGYGENNLCILYLDGSACFSSVLYYPAVATGNNGYPLKAAEPNQYYSIESSMDLYNLEGSQTFPSVELGDTLKSLDNPWNQTEDFSEQEIASAHGTGIPIVAGTGSMELYSRGTPFPGSFWMDFQDRYLKVQDNCGNTIRVKSKWSGNHYISNSETGEPVPVFIIIDARPA